MESCFVFIYFMESSFAMNILSVFAGRGEYLIVFIVYKYENNYDISIFIA